MMKKKIVGKRTSVVNERGGHGERRESKRYAEKERERERGLLVTHDS